MLKTTHGNKSERIHALDSLRAIMMLLGLVLHAAITYGTGDYSAGWGLKDTEATSLIMDYLVLVIHNFRMPIFFVVAEFFGALLFFERGPLKMLKNRLDRILYPLVVFIIIIAPTIVFSFTFSNAAVAGAENPLTNALSPFSNWRSFLPIRTYHLWFLYYLFLISIVSFGLGLLFEKLPKFTNWATELLNRILKRPLLKVLVMSAITVIILFIMKTTWVATSISWIVDWKTFLFYFFFYVFGWILFKSKSKLDTFKEYDWLFTFLAFAIISYEFFFGSTMNFEIAIILNSLAVWLFTFGFTGLFLRYGSKHSHLMRYNSDSSYWIYLLHLSIVSFIPGLIASWQVSAILKFLFVFLLTSLICVVTYHYLVRATFIGKFLNGRKYSRKI